MRALVALPILAPGDLQSNARTRRLPFVYVHVTRVASGTRVRAFRLRGLRRSTLLKHRRRGCHPLDPPGAPDSIRTRYLYIYIYIYTQLQRGSSLQPTRRAYAVFSSLDAVEASEVRTRPVVLVEWGTRGRRRIDRPNGRGETRRATRRVAQGGTHGAVPTRVYFPHGV